MKQLKRIAATAFAAAALAVTIGAGSASATTLEVAGITQNQWVPIDFRLASFTSTILSRTDGSLANTCTSSRISSSTVSPFTGITVKAQVIGLRFEECERPVTVHWPGDLSIKHTAGTNGTVSLSGTQMTLGSPFGTLNCSAGAGTHIGTLTGKGWGGWSTLHVNAVLNCGFFVPSASWKGTYDLTHGEGLGVSA